MSTERLILDNVPWEYYTRYLHIMSDRHLRLTYDRGVLEIMRLSHEHENTSCFLGRFVITLTEELSFPVKEGRSTTFRRRKKKKGIEADNSYWIAHEAAVRSKKVINLRIDPPPDLAIEVDVSRSSMNRMGIYASLKVPEVWRHDEHGLAFLVLNAKGKYDPAATSPTFPLPITPADLMVFVNMLGQKDENAIIREFRLWIRAKLAAAKP
jgi:Uma2 family endonuclease